MRRTLLIGFGLVVVGVLLAFLANAIVGLVVAVIGVGFAIPTGGSGSEPDSTPTIFTDGGGHGGGGAGAGPS